MDFIAGRANRQSRSRNNDSLLTASLSKRGRACLVKALTKAITSEPQLNTRQRARSGEQPGTVVKRVSRSGFER